MKNWKNLAPAARKGSLEHDLDLEQEAGSHDSPDPGDDGVLAPNDDGTLAPGDDNFAPGAQDEAGGREAQPVAFLVDLMAELEAAKWSAMSPDVMSMTNDGQPMLAIPPKPERVHQVRCNPPVTMKDWDDPDDDSETPEASDDNNEPAAGEDRDPEYIERAEGLGFNPNDKPSMDDKQLGDFLEMHLGDLAEDEWINLC
ncbi:hypothetical protein FRC06_003032 [Ceratobasidium sp. 370]|nr:hypothetical protein FRC06_003032 [Ceratobasidium sp. 370]